MSTKPASPSPLQHTAAGLLLLALAACTSPAPPPVTAAAAFAPAAAGTARIWFYRDYEPSVSRNFATVLLNGVPAASIPPEGTASYRDVPPGHYHVAAESYGMDEHQASDVDLGAGEEAFVKVLASGSWESGGDTTQFQRDTFYISLVPPQVARAELSPRPLKGG